MLEKQPAIFRDPNDPEMSKYYSLKINYELVFFG